MQKLQSFCRFGSAKLVVRQTGWLLLSQAPSAAAAAAADSAVAAAAAAVATDADAALRRLRFIAAITLPALFIIGETSFARNEI